MLALKVTTIGNSVGVVLPKEMTAKLKVKEGDTLYLAETPDGYRLTPYDPEFERQMQLAEELRRERRNVLHELAK
ncbi:AbrB/MazE/SpoVT family DNA-binding domain-containing protein [Azospirillum doebereinerae]|uniref:AbrB/MazE/SpoVT family DNA-binding domain-containing protein n=1 Tax=Azospirillum doebereinerae TaxID=92933 RepID=UPI001EE5DA4D|nr:AbrB/MazE/SpoVT family DNA-binding domain-containing protein [Azospirillum doebereinerae]MCG5241882.1 AbrB/MazE/SpoVT family DNA-binding domain-containing protein [Azospirillum doebereinerae]